jgi:hypothetical protein
MFFFSSVAEIKKRFFVKESYLFITGVVKQVFRGKILLHLLLVAAITLISLEVVLRVLYDHNSKIKNLLYSSRYDINFSRIKTEEDIKKYAPCTLEPLTNVNGFIINSRGYYSSDYQQEKAENVLRIGFIGDSFLVGVVPYPDHYVNIFSELFINDKKNNKIHLETINWGKSCLGPNFEKKIFDVEVLKSKPDYLIWNFFVGNDFTDEQYENTKLPLKNYLVKNIYVLRLIRNLQKIVSGTYLSANFSMKGKTYNQGGYFDKLETPYDPNSSTFTHDKYLKVLQDKLIIFRQDTFPYQSWNYIKSIFKDVQDKCSENRIKCFVIIIPDELQVNKELQKQIVNQESYDFEYPQKELATYFKSENIPYLDLLPIFEKSAETNNYYQPNDSHWNIGGNKMAAEIVYSYFQKNYGNFYH